MKTLSNHAQAAKDIREYCKSIGVKCSARSDSYSMGCSVRVEVTNQPPEIVKKIESFANQRQYGHFNGMEDIYEYTNSRTDIAQAKYVFVSNLFTPDMYQAAWEMLKASASNGNDKPALYDDAKRLQWCSASWNYDDMIEMYVRKILVGGGYDYVKNLSDQFWSSRKQPESVKTEHVTVDSVTVRGGTKPGYSEVLFPAKPEQSVIEKLKSAGYRWSSFNKVWYGKTENLPIQVQP